MGTLGRLNYSPFIRVIAFKKIKFIETKLNDIPKVVSRHVCVYIYAIMLRKISLPLPKINTSSPFHVKG